jgi:hypothetical protein
MTCGTPTQYPIKVSGDLKKVTVFTALHPRWYLTNSRLSPKRNTERTRRKIEMIKRRVESYKKRNKE